MLEHSLIVVGVRRGLRRERRLGSRSLHPEKCQRPANVLAYRTAGRQRPRIQGKSQSSAIHNRRIVPSQTALRPSDAAGCVRLLL